VKKIFANLLVSPELPLKNPEIYLYHLFVLSGAILQIMLKNYPNKELLEAQICAIQYKFGFPAKEGPIYPKSKGL